MKFVDELKEMAVAAQRIKDAQIAEDITVIVAAAKQVMVEHAKRGLYCARFPRGDLRLNHEGSWEAAKNVIEAETGVKTELFANFVSVYDFDWS